MTRLHLSIRRYKCFESLVLGIDQLTVLTGKNGVGKSSVTQALRLHREAATADSGPNVQFYLNRSDFLLGTFDEVLYSGDGKREYTFEVALRNGTGVSQEYVFSPAEADEECEYVTVGTPAGSGLSIPSERSFIYLSAERFGPRLRQERTDGHRTSNIGVGSRGEFSAEVLANSTTTRIDSRLIYGPRSEIEHTRPNDLLRTNLEAWMSSIVGEIQIRASRPPRLSLPYLEFLTPGATNDWQFPTNHGFGISYILPIVLAGLILDEDGILIVDTPEAHLHPAAQTALAMFLATVASANRRVIVETHSDHIVDGFRLAVANKTHPLCESEAVIHYFARKETGTVNHIEITPRADGTLPKWPVGFFDQIPANLRMLQELNKPNAP